MKNEKVLVLEGGFNEEHEVSLATGKQVKKVLIENKIKHRAMTVDPNTFDKDIYKFNKEYICFNALHGTFGEDGKIQKILDNASFRYTHSNSKSSNIGFDKELTKKNIHDTKIKTPKYLTIENNDINKDFLFQAFNNFGPFLIKPIASGSSYGIYIFKDFESINFFLNDLDNNIKIYKNHKKLLIEEYIRGRELTVAVIDENKESFSIEVTEIISNSKFFDYKSKYTPGFSKHILPAKIPKDIYDRCKSYAKIAHDKIGCNSISRSDFIYDNDEVYFLEINTQPGLTPISLVPEQLKYKNISFDELILNIIKAVL